MDSISSSTGLMWLFALMYIPPILLVLFSVMIWTYNKFKRLSFIAYIADIVFMLFILWTDISNVITYLPWKRSIYNLCITNSIFLLISIIGLVISIYYYRKNKVVCNISINIATILSVIVWFIIIKMVNM